MADLKDMAYTASEVKAQNKMIGVEAADAKTPTYSWGLNFRLEQSELDKLGIDELPEAGEEINFDMRCKVVRVAQSADEKNKSSVVELQITKLGIETGTDDDDDDVKPASTKKVTSVMSYNGGKRG